MPVNRQGPAAALRLGGTAKSLVRSLDVATLRDGRVIADANGQPVQLTGLQSLTRALAARFAPLEQEMIIFSVAELLQFRKQGNESMDECPARFEQLRHLAFDVATFDMGII